MLTIIRRLWLGAAVIIAAAAILLLSDLRSRRDTGSGRPLRIAVVKLVSNSLLDDVEAGLIEKLNARGFGQGVTRYSAEGDIATANAIARQVTDGGYRMVISISTVMMQIVAAANREGRTVHVFAAVTDPAGAGVGIERLDSLQKPAYMTGLGTFQPVEAIFRKAREFFPELKVVGTAWNPAEANSAACMQKARSLAAELGITLHEAPIEQAGDVPQAAESLIGRGVQAIWAGCDATLNTGIDALCAAAGRARIPVFSNSGRHVLHGSLFDVGADYVEVGRAAADLAAAILEGADPALIPVRNFMPETLMLNLQVLQGLRDPWSFPPSARAAAALEIDEQGVAHAAQERSRAAAPLPRKLRVTMVNYVESPLADEAARGIHEGLAQSGLQAGRDYTLSEQNAQGDMATLAGIFDAAEVQGTDLYLVLSTPALQTALQKVRGKPVVFTFVADPFRAGAGRSDAEHLPNVTGVYTLGPYAELAELLARHYPQLKRVGTLFCPAEANSLTNRDLFVSEAGKHGITVVSAPANSAADIPDAALSLTAKRLDAIVQITDNLSAAGFASIAKAARAARLPLFGSNVGAVEQGAGVALSRDYFDAGVEAAKKAAQVMRGVPPADIPFSPPRVVKTLVSPRNAADLGMAIPEELARRADVMDAPGTAAPGRRWRIRLIQQVDAPAIEESRRGVQAGRAEAGLAAGRDYVRQLLAAQGDLATLSSLVDAALTDRADMIYTITTPALQTAMQKVRTLPIIFTLALDPLLIGDQGTHTVHRPNVAGVFDRSPFEQMMALLHEAVPGARRIGTLYAPAEPNSVNFREELEKAARAAGLEVSAVPSGSPSEVADAALALVQQRPDLICQIHDNLHDAAFPTIAAAASRARLPRFSFSAAQAESGAAVALSNDHFDGGRESALMAARVMRGESPAAIPYRGVSKVKLTVNLKAAGSFGFTVPESVIRRADRVIRR